MAEEFDIEAMLEAPYNKNDEEDTPKDNQKPKNRDKDRDRKDRVHDKDRKDKDREKEKRSHNPSRDRSASKDHKKKRSSSRDRCRDHDRRNGRGRDRDRGHGRSRSRDKRHSRDHRRSRSRSVSPYRGGRYGRFGGGGRFGKKRSFSKSPLRNSNAILTPEERDARTVFCMQLSARIRPRDLEEFFSSVGKVTDVKIITDNKTRRSKGIAYVEFADENSVPLAIGLAGQKLLGVPIIVQVSQAEKNRLANAQAQLSRGVGGPMRLYVGSLHFNITEDMLRGIFEPFGRIDNITLVMDPETNRSKGFGFVTFREAEDAKKAMEQLNGFELAGRPMKVGNVTEKQGMDEFGVSMLDTDEMDRQGVDLGATGRLALMAKLAEGTGFQIPQAASNALKQAHDSQAVTMNAISGGGGGGGGGVSGSGGGGGGNTGAPPIATQCFMLSNMFDPNNEAGPTWDKDIRDDVIEECNKHGGVLHIYVDKDSPQGNVYVKCPSIAAAVASVQSLHGRWFAGKVITAAYVPVQNYHNLFPEGIRATTLVTSAGSGAY